MAKKQRKSPKGSVFRNDMAMPTNGAHKGHFDLIKEAGDVPKRLVGDEIRYQCQKCGNCCRKGFSIELSVDEMDYLTKKHPEIKTVFAYTKGDYVHPFFNTGPKCTMLKGNQCRIYRNRPFECKYYPFHLVEVDSKTPNAYEYGKKHYQLYVYEECGGLGKGEPWSDRKMNSFLKRILQEYVKHRSMLKITYKVLTTDAFFKDRKQYGTGVIYGTDREIDEFLKDYHSKLELFEEDE